MKQLIPVLFLETVKGDHMQQRSVWHLTQSTSSQEALEEELCALLTRLETLFFQEMGEAAPPGCR
jgi:hypothetical protein